MRNKSAILLGVFLSIPFKTYADPMIWVETSDKAINFNSNWDPDHSQSSSESDIRWTPFNPAESSSHKPNWELISSDDSNYTDVEKLVQASPDKHIPSVQTLNRSIAFSDSTPGPDVAWKVPQGFKWSEDWIIDLSTSGANTRPSGSNFWSWNNGDATAELHARIFQTPKWSFVLNSSVRSVYQGSSFGGGATQIGDGLAAGFRFDLELTKSSGLAFGAEQLVQFDSNNDTGRNFYLVGSKAWWLGDKGKTFPLLVSTVGIGTGRFGDNNTYQFGCTSSINSSIDATQSFPLCWSPIASAAIVLSNDVSIFSEYNSQDVLAGLSLSLNNSFPARLSWGVLVANKGSDYSYAGTDNLRWFFRASLGF